MEAEVAALAHAGFGLLSAEMTSGKVLFGVFSFLVGTGIVWRLVYSAVPPLSLSILRIRWSAYGFGTRNPAATVWAFCQN